MSPLNIDLHTHSTCSDGALTPTELVTRAGECGIEVLALTDHDTVAGIAEARSAADGIGLRLIPGTEISAAWRSQVIHILGLWIDPENAALRGRLAQQSDRRRDRMVRICARLDRQRLPGADLLRDVGRQPGVPTRSHLAVAMVARGVVRTPQEAFRKYLTQGKAAHVAADWPPLAEIIGWIRAAGGVAALAHPVRYAISSAARRQLLQEFAAAGGTALEVVTGGNGLQHVETCSMLASKYGLFGSVGSDFHDPKLAWNPLGRSLKLPDCVTPVWRSFGL